MEGAGSSFSNAIKNLFFCQAIASPCCRQGAGLTHEPEPVLWWRRGIIVRAQNVTSFQLGPEFIQTWPRMWKWTDLQWWMFNQLSSKPSASARFECTQNITLYNLMFGGFFWRHSWLLQFFYVTDLQRLFDVCWWEFIKSIRAVEVLRLSVSSPCQRIKWTGLNLLQAWMPKITLNNIVPTRRRLPTATLFPLWDFLLENWDLWSSWPFYVT